MRNRLRLCVFITLMMIALLGSQSILFGQGTASISGTIADATHAAVPGANVVLTNSENQPAHAKP